MSFMCLKTLTRVVAHFLSSKRMYTDWLLVVPPPPEPLECMLWLCLSSKVVAVTPGWYLVGLDLGE